MRSPAALVRRSVVLVLIALLSGILPNPAAAIDYTYLQVGVFDDRGQPIEGITFSLTADNGATIPQSEQATSAYGFAEFPYVPTGSTITLDTAYKPPAGYELVVVGTETSGSELADPALVMPFRYEPETSVRRTVTIEQRAISVPTPTPTPIPPTATPIPPTSTPEPTATLTPSPTSTPVPTSTPTATPFPPTSTPVPTPTPTATPFPPTSTPVPTPTATLIPVNIPIPTSTPSPAITPTEIPISPTATLALAETIIPLATPGPTMTPVVTSVPTYLATSPTVTGSPIASATIESPAVTDPTFTPTNTVTPTTTPTSTLPPATPITLDATATPFAPTNPASPVPASTTSPVPPEPTSDLTPPLATFAAPVVASVAILYTDSAGQGLAGAWFQLDAADCQAPFQAARLTDLSGSVRFFDVPHGTYCLVQSRASERFDLMIPTRIVIDHDEVSFTILAVQSTPLDPQAPNPHSMPGTRTPMIAAPTAPDIAAPPARLHPIALVLPATGTGDKRATSRAAFFASLALIGTAALIASRRPTIRRRTVATPTGRHLD